MKSQAKPLELIPLERLYKIQESFRAGKIFPLDMKEALELCAMAIMYMYQHEEIAGIVQKLEGQSANTDTDPRWRAATILRELLP